MRGDDPALTAVRGIAAFWVFVYHAWLTAGPQLLTLSFASLTLDLTPLQVTDLEKGRFYVQLHSEKAPDGNLWGWLLPAEKGR